MDEIQKMKNIIEEQNRLMEILLELIENVEKKNNELRKEIRVMKENQ